MWNQANPFPERDFSIPPHYIQWGEPANYVEAQIPEGSTLRCYPAEIMSPSHFYLNLTENWFKLETFQRKLQGAMRASDAVYELRVASSPRMALLAPGLFVICEYFGPRDTRKEWHRAMILENPIYGDGPGIVSKHHSQENLQGMELSKIPIKVLLVDYGTIFETNIDNIRYMQRSMLEMPIQAIECQLNFRPPFAEYLENQGHVWPAAASNLLASLCCDRVLGVTFCKRTLGGVQTDEVKQLKWIVSVDLMEGQANDTKVNDTTPTPKSFTTLKVVDPEPIPPSNHEEPEVQAERERRAFVREMDPSLVLHPDGCFSNLVPPQHHDLSVDFIKWIRQPPKEETEGRDSADFTNSDCPI